MFQAKQLVSLIRFGEEESQELDFEKLESDPRFQQYVTSKVEKVVEPIKTSRAKTLNEKKTLAERLKSLESGVQEKEDLEALRAGKLDLQALLDKRINANSSSWQEKLAAEQAEKDDLRKAVSERELKLQDIQIRHQVAQVALKNEFFQQSALDDLVHIAGSTWKLNDAGGFVARDSSGNILLGKNGVPVTPDEWVQSLTSTKPHYFRDLPGSGSRGGNGTGRVIKLGDWQKILMSASTDAEKDALKTRFKIGEFVIQH